MTDTLNTTAAIADRPAIPGEVNVIFRGLFLFIARQRGIDVLIPNMGHEHVNRAGSWLGETTVMPRPLHEPYVLSGVTAGTAHFPQNESLWFFGYDAIPHPTMEELHARLAFSTPKEIIALRPTIADIVPALDPLGFIGHRKPKGVLVFRYDSVDLEKVFLYQHTNAGDLPHHDMGTYTDQATGQYKRFLNLHVVSEPDRMPAHDPKHSNHSVLGFDRMINLLSGVQGAVKLSPESVTSLALPEDIYREKGFHPYETLNLIETRSLLAQAARRWRIGGSVFPQLPSFIDRPPFSCLPAVGGRD